MNNTASPPEVWPRVPPIQAGIWCRCPRCGRGPLFVGVLTVATRCKVCDLDLSVNDAGDGPAVFVIFILGFFFVPLALGVEAWFEPPIWLHLIAWPPLIIVLAILFLRPMKAIIVAYHFKNLQDKYDS